MCDVIGIKKSGSKTFFGVGEWWSTTPGNPSLDLMGGA
jgi:hypothetical protein